MNDNRKEGRPMARSRRSAEVWTLICVAALLMLAVGCTTISEHPSAWVGREVSRLETAWGPPARVDEGPDVRLD